MRNVGCRVMLLSQSSLRVPIASIAPFLVLVLVLASAMVVYDSQLHEAR